MGDLLRITYEQSFFAPDATLMLWLWQQPFGSLWILGRALLTLYHWPLLGGFVARRLLPASSPALALGTVPASLGVGDVDGLARARTLFPA